METYRQMKDRQQKEVNDFLKKYAFFAFSKDQFEKGMKSLGLSDTEKLCYLGYSGGYILKEHVSEFAEMMKRFDEERAAAIADQEHGKEFALQMFRYELANHEYTYTLDFYETIEALGYSVDDINNNDRLLEALREAARQLREEAEE